MADLRTSDAFIKALEDASSKPLSYEQLEQQRLSFVMGSLPHDRDLTREQVQDILERHEGRRPAAG